MNPGCHSGLYVLKCFFITYLIYTLLHTQVFPPGGPTVQGVYLVLEGSGSDPAPAGPQEESSPAPTEAPEVFSTTSRAAPGDPAVPTPEPELDPAQPPPTAPEVLSLSPSHTGL